jgi:uncharacterized membrane protein required for colicin V production
MTWLDWGLLGFAALCALSGYRRGLIGTALSLVGLVVGAIAGARIAPHFLSGGKHSEYTALVGLGGGLVGAMLGQLLASLVGSFIRGGLRLVPPLHLLDSLGGLAVGAAWGMALVWVAGAVALQIHGHPKVRREVRHSHVLRQLNRIAPPHDVLRIQAQLGRLPSA